MATLTDEEYLRRHQNGVLTDEEYLRYHKSKVLTLLGVYDDFFPGFRGWEYRKNQTDEEQIVVCCRIGGKNRGAFHKSLQRIAQHPQYIYDEDDHNYDNTAEIFFRKPTSNDTNSYRKPTSNGANSYQKPTSNDADSYLNLLHMLLDKQTEFNKFAKELNELKQRCEVARFKLLSKDEQKGLITQLIHQTFLTITMGHGLKNVERNKRRRVDGYNHYKSIYGFEEPITHFYKPYQLPDEYKI